MAPMLRPSPWLAHLAAAAVLLSSWALLCADASVHDYAGERFVEDGNAFVLHGGSEGVYASAAAGAFIRFEKVAFKRTPPEEEDVNRTATVTAVIFESGDRDAVGGADVSGDRVLCCTPAMAERGDCTEGALVHRARRNGWPKVLTASFPAGRRPRGGVVPGRDGPHLPHGHVHPPLRRLPRWRRQQPRGTGERQDDLEERPRVPSRADGPAGALLRAAVAGVRVAGGVVVRAAREALAPRGAAAGLGGAADRAGDGGVRHVVLRPGRARRVRGPAPGAALWAVTAGAARGAVSRVLALLVAMGHGVVRPAMAGLTARVVGLGAAFFVATEALEVVENVGTVSDHSLSLARRLGLALPVAVLNAVFVYWIFSSLSKTMSKLKATRMTLKLEMYRKFTNALIIGVALSLGWTAFETHFKSTDEYNERWRAAWVIPAVWQLISFSLLCAVCLIWAPSHSSMRYAYSDEEDCEEYCDDLDDKRPLIRPGPLSYVDSWAISVSPDDTKVILRTDSGVYAKAGDGDKRV
ncbi:hypothetical protein PR202_ga29198 [Eleusine coracana subsp. coracana]|uniref:GOST seven transmembrane domain-containing protein n=1 Tax=Eleusine coracana subsp. coracana TaxID=191504 RepID=A0AAV5DIY9_ELECO|nr:hypothetical protein PR202_ga29198 [Eleusine coracana subsp. coracana]